MSHLSEQELFFNSLFEAEHGVKDLTTDTKISVNFNLPDKLNGLLNNAKLTLLAEVGIYQLWFPLEFIVDDKGQVTPTLCPEVIDTKGIERSWRTPQPRIANRTIPDYFTVQHGRIVATQKC